MQKLIKSLSTLLLFSLLFSTSCKDDPTMPSEEPPMPLEEPKTVTDYDGNVYNTIKIGDQIWMAENLKVTHYRDGTPIPNVVSDSQWVNLTTGAYCAYKNENENVETYGLLYNWYAAKDTRNIAPPGWRVSANQDYIKLENFLIDNGYQWDGNVFGNKIAKSLCTSTGWNTSSDSGDVGNDMSTNNTSGFSALPGGYRYNYLGPFISTFSSMNLGGRWWLSSEYDATTAWSRELHYNKHGLSSFVSGKTYGFSLRLIWEG